MFRRKFIDRLKNKYQSGGEKATTYVSKGAHLLEGVSHIAPKIAGNVGRLAGGAGIPLVLADFYNRGQRLSGGKVNVNQESFLEDSINNTKSIFTKQEGGMYDQMQQYQNGGEKEETRREKNQRIKNYTHPYLEQYYDKFAETGYGGGNISNKKEVRNILSEMNITPSDTAFIGAHHDSRVLDNEVDGQLNRYIFSQLSDQNTDVNLSRSNKMPFFSSEPNKDGKSYSFMENKYYNDSSSKPTIWDPRPAVGSVTKVIKSRQQTGGMYDQMQQYQEGGMQLPGGQMQPIPGSDAVEFSGADHDEGGIMIDPQTEVEDGETMDQVTMAKHGGKRKDYFFSSHLKEGGKSYAGMHKDILKNGGSQEEINMLARMQEVAAGRNPKQVAKLGGIAKYQEGSFYRDPVGPVATPIEPDIYQDGQVIIGEDGLETYVTPGQLTADLVEGDFSQLQANKQLQESQKEQTLEQMRAAEDLAAQQELFDKAQKKGRKGGGVPTEAYVGMGLQAIPSIYALLHKQKPAEQVGYTPGFTSPVVASTVKAQKLDRVNYNDKRSNLTSSIRGMNKFIETSGGGPANIANLQATLAKEIGGQMKIDAAETQANIAIDNKEKQLAQQTALDNVKRSQAASQFNAQMIRAEAAREDTIETTNAAARQKLKEDKEQNIMNAITSGVQGIAGGIGDVMTYKAGERMAEVMGTEGIYQRDIMRKFVKRRASKDGIPGICEAGDCTDAQINKFITGKFGEEKEV